MVLELRLSGTTDESSRRKGEGRGGEGREGREEEGMGGSVVGLDECVEGPVQCSSESPNEEKTAHKQEKRLARTHVGMCRMKDEGLWHGESSICFSGVERGVDRDTSSVS